MAQAKEHRYAVTTQWAGAAEGPARDYESYSREHRFEIPGKPAIVGSSDPNFMGDASRHNPEELLVASLSGCHMLWYLHLCTVKGVVVEAYEDAAVGLMVEEPRNGRMTEVTLRPVVTISADSDATRAEQLHERAHAECFIANSMNFPVRCLPTIRKADSAAA